VSGRSRWTPTRTWRRHRKRQPADRLAAGQEWEEAGLLISDERGRMIKQWRLTLRFKELIGEAGLPSIVLHEGVTQRTACGARRALTPASGRRGWVTARSS
jgi:hypothetical protein